MTREQLLLKATHDAVKQRLGQLDHHIALLNERFVGLPKEAPAPQVYNRVEVPSVEVHPPRVEVAAPSVTVDTAALADSLDKFGKAVADNLRALGEHIEAQSKAMDERFAKLLRVLSEQKAPTIEVQPAKAPERKPVAYRIEHTKDGKRLVPEG